MGLLGDRDLKQLNKTIGEARMVVKMASSGRLPDEMNRQALDRVCASLQEATRTLIKAGRQKEAFGVLDAAAREPADLPPDLWMQMIDRARG